MKKIFRNIILLIFVGMFLCLLGGLADKEVIFSFIKISPTVNSVFLAGFAAMFVLLLVADSKDFVNFIVYERMQGKRFLEEHHYIRYLHSMKQDAYILIFGLSLSLLALLLSKITIPVVINGVKFNFNFGLWFAISGILVGCGVMIDIVEAIFALNELKYALTGHRLQFEDQEQRQEVGEKWASKD